jgi:glycosyltransferase involved in cell wall biosynthesis
MNVALVAPPSAAHPGALERHVRTLARGLVSHGVAVELLSQGRDPGTTGVSEVDGVLERRFAASLRNRHLPIAPALSEYLRRTSFDLVHAHYTHPLLALAAARARPERLVVSPLAPMERLLRWPYSGATRAAVHLATQTICMSHSDAALLSRAIPIATNRVRVLPQGVDVGAIRRARPFPEVSSLILTVGRLVRQKRVDRAIAAIAGLRPSFELIVIGDGPARRRFKAYAADLQVSSRVRFAGWVSDSDLHRWLRTARLLVTLSEQEAFGLQVLEGLAAGIPVVASDIPAHREAASFARAEVTFVSPEGSPLEVVDAILNATTTRVLETEAPIPSWADVVDATLELYEELMRHASSTGARRARSSKTRVPQRNRQGTLVIKG